MHSGSQAAVHSAQKAIVMVSAFSRQRGLVLAQEKVNKKSNEITAVPKLLKVLKLSGAIVSIDALLLSEKNCESDCRAKS